MDRAVIFDVDGTIVDSVGCHAEAWKLAFEHFGKVIPIDSIRRQIGKGADQLLPEFFTQQELNQFGSELDRYRAQLFQRDFLPKVKAFDGVRELFERIKHDGRQIALASSAKKSELGVYKKLANIDDLIDVETSSDDIDRSKPHADVFNSALSMLGSGAPENVTAVGDTPYDAQAAAKARISTLGLLSGVWSAEELRQAGCIAVYGNVADLLKRYTESLLVTRA
jgi:HAD superfamily hydrolase (TIGR01549 family)